MLLPVRKQYYTARYYRARFVGWAAFRCGNQHRIWHCCL